jgi:SAM-dependent methyltransferase
MGSPLVRRIRDKLVCPSCRVALDDVDGGELACGRCGKEVRVTSDRYDFGGLSEEDEKSDWLNALKGAAKRRLGRAYPLAIEVLAPVYGQSGIKPFLAGFAEDALICDLGAGTSTYPDERVVCVDGYPYPNVHVVCDLGALPFADASVDGIISGAVLEHVPDPEAHVAEMKRVLRPGGRVLCFFPFMQPFHASPHDYGRRTLPGLLRLFEGFTIDSARVSGGPTSGLLWTLQEWLAIAGSFGSERLYRALVPLTWVLSPLKYLDVLLIRHPAAQVIASGFTIEATRP